MIRILWFIHFQLENFITRHFFILISAFLLNNNTRYLRCCVAVHRGLEKSSSETKQSRGNMQMTYMYLESFAFLIGASAFLTLCKMRA